MPRKQPITNATIIAAARKRFAGKRDFNATIKGLRCPHCRSRDTLAEFYRLPSFRAPRVGVVSCNTCGAC